MFLLFETWCFLFSLCRRKISHNQLLRHPDRRREWWQNPRNEQNKNHVRTFFFFLLIGFFFYRFSMLFGSLTVVVFFPCCCCSIFCNIRAQNSEETRKQMRASSQSKHHDVTYSRSSSSIDWFFVENHRQKENKCSINNNYFRSSATDHRSSDSDLHDLRLFVTWLHVRQRELKRKAWNTQLYGFNKKMKQNRINEIRIRQGERTNKRNQRSVY